MYDHTSDIPENKEARKQQLTLRSRSLENLPTNTGSTEQHIKRVSYQPYCWNQVLIPNPDLPSPANWDWKKDQTGYQPLWTTLPEAPWSCSELICCGCKKDCTGRCKCFKAALKCTALCFCSGECTGKCKCFKAALKCTALCFCSGECTGKCKCFKAALKCTALCFCSGECTGRCKCFKAALKCTALCFRSGECTGRCKCFKAALKCTGRCKYYKAALKCNLLPFLKDCHR